MEHEVKSLLCAPGMLRRYGVSFESWHLGKNHVEGYNGQTGVPEIGHSWRSACDALAKYATLLC
jgi:hypothetical protein